MLILLRSEIPSGMCFAPWQQATIEIMLAISLTIACSRYIYNGVFSTHIPFVVNHTINATPPARLQQYLCWRCLEHSCCISLWWRTIYLFWLTPKSIPIAPLIFTCYVSLGAYLSHLIMGMLAESTFNFELFEILLDETKQQIDFHQETCRQINISLVTSSLLTISGKPCG